MSSGCRVFPCRRPGEADPVSSRPEQVTESDHKQRAVRPLLFNAAIRVLRRRVRMALCERAPGEAQVVRDRIDVWIARSGKSVGVEPIQCIIVDAKGNSSKNILRFIIFELK